MSSFAQAPGLEDIPDLFIANWTTDVEVTTEYRTDVRELSGDVEVRRGAVDRGLKTMRVQLSGLTPSATDAALLHSLVEARTKNRVRVPVWPDFVTLTAAAPMGATSLAVTATGGRRFTSGQRVFVAFPSEDGVVKWDYEVRTLSSIGANALGIDATSRAWPAGTRVYPAMKADVTLNDTIAAVTSQIGDGILTFREVYDAETAQPLALASAEPEFAGIPIFALPTDGTEVRQGWSRQGSSSEVGLDSVVDVYGVGARFVLEATYTGSNRGECRRLTAFFESRRGKLKNFWLSSATADFQIKAATSTQITCVKRRPRQSTADLHVGKHVAFVKRTGEVSIHRVSSAVTNGSGEVVLTLATAVDLSQFGPDKIARGSWCYLCRFDRDEIVETWSTDEIMSTRLRAISLRTSGDGEYVPDVPDVQDPRTGVPDEEPWTPGDDCAEPASPTVDVPMFFFPCGSLPQDRDPARPVIRSADWRMPKTFKLSIGKLLKDKTLHGSKPFVELMRRLRGDVMMDYDATLDQNGVPGRHWLHTRAKGSFLVDWTFYWDVPVGGVTVNRRVWRSSATYSVGETQHSLEIYLIAEWNPAIPDGDGLWGTGFFLHVFSSEPATYVDGTPIDLGDGGPTFSFTKRDPCVAGPSVERLPHQRYVHPQLALTGAFATSYHTPCRYSWYPPDNLANADSGLPDQLFSNSRASCYALLSSAPWIVAEAGIDWPDGFSRDARRLTLLGAASIEAGELVLTKARPRRTWSSGLVGLRSAAWYSHQKQDLRFGFETTFKFRVTEPTATPGEGFAFVIQNSGATALGTDEEGLGYAGIIKSVAVEFDSAASGSSDTTANHVSIQTDFLNANRWEDSFSRNKAACPFVISDGEEHEVRITYTVSGSKVLSVYLDGSATPVVSAVLDLESVLGSGQTAWVGFTGSTGANYQDQRILEWTLRVAGQTDELTPAGWSLRNSTFGDHEGDFDYGYAAMTLGGDCPQSSPTAWLCIEDTPGLTPLRAEQPGWDARRGGLWFEEPSITIEFCNPDQPLELDCCDGDASISIGGSGRCWQNSDWTSECCFGYESSMRVDVKQWLVVTVSCFNEVGGIADGGHSARPERIIESFQQFDAVDEWHYNQGYGSGGRSIEWRRRPADPAYQFRTHSDDFTDADAFDEESSTWVPSLGSGPRRGVTCVSDSALGYLYQDPRPGDVSASMRDATIAAAMDGPLGTHGLVLRGDGQKGYVIEFSDEFGTLSIVKYTNPLGTPIREVIAVTSGAGDRVAGWQIEATISGSQMSAKANGAAGISVTADDCEYHTGRFGLLAKTGAVYSSYALEDVGPDKLECVLHLDPVDGWFLSLPERSLGAYQFVGCEGCTDCTLPISCCGTETVASPASIIINQPSPTTVGLTGYMKMAVPAGGPPSGFVFCDAAHSFVPPTEAARLSVVSDDASCEPEGGEAAACSSFSVWWRQCTSDA